MSHESVTCQLCGHGALRRPIEGNHRIYQYWNCHCGSHYYVTRHDVSARLECAAERAKLSLERLASLLYERQVQRLPYPFLQFDESAFRKVEYPEVPDSVPLLAQDWAARDWPRTVAEKIDRSLCNLARKSSFAGEPVHLGDRDFHAFFTNQPLEWEYILNALRQYRWIDVVEDKSRKPFSSPDFVVRLAPTGWTRFQELTAGQSSRMNPAFVAMWFGGKEQKSKMLALYDDAIVPAVTEAGYRVRRADSQEHNNYIMDQVRGYIRMAPFVVAELTNHNQGVYYEAGFAAGLGIQVIPCCPEDEKSEIHFDIAQINQIRWAEPEGLRRQLKARILGSIGAGPDFDESGA